MPWSDVLLCRSLARYVSHCIYTDGARDAAIPRHEFEYGVLTLLVEDIDVDFCMKGLTSMCWKLLDTHLQL